MSTSAVSTSIANSATAPPATPGKDKVEALGASASAAPLPPLTNSDETQGARRGQEGDEADRPARRKCDFTVAGFSHKSKAMATAGRDKIDEIMRKIDGYVINSIVIVGHIDSSELPTDDDDDDVAILGLERASTARNYFTSQYRVRRDYIYIEDLGDTHPASTDDGPAEPASNRRVEITLKLRRRSAIQADDGRDAEDDVVFCYLPRKGGRAECA